MERREKYINFFTDFGFKRLFGEESSKDLLQDFLNSLLGDREGKIKALSFLKNEQLGRSKADRKAVYDIYCENEKGEKFIVELQKTRQDFFKDRALFYSTFPIRQQAITGSDWNFELKAVYCVAILDFIFKGEEAYKDKLIYRVKLTDIETCKVFYDKLTFVFLEMPKFRKERYELKTRFEKWLYVIKNLHQLDSLPEELQSEVFKRIFKLAEVANLSEEDHNAYEESLKHYRDLKNVVDTAHREGIEKGRKEEEEKRKEVERKHKKAEQKRKEAEQKHKEAELELGAFRLSRKGLSSEEIATQLGKSVEWTEKILNE